MNRNIIPALSFYLEPDEWLTQKFGCPVWRVEQGNKENPISQLKAISEPFFAYAKVNAEEVYEVSYLSDKGFRVVDLALTFARPVARNEAKQSIINTPELRFAKPTDKDAVAHIAGHAFRYSRFHLDPNISLKTANAIKSEWAVNYFSGMRGDGMVVAERDGRVVGFLQLIWKENTLAIDLIAVAAAYQGQGIGREMILYASCYGTGDHRRSEWLRVGTQAANVPSVRLYESLGFRLVKAEYVLHCHSG